MFFRALNFLLLMAFSLPAAVTAMPAGNDLLIAYDIPRHKKHVLFQNVVQNAIPGKPVPDDYHITLGIVKNVKNTDAGLLRKNLESIAQIHLNNASFTVTAASAKRYLVNRAPDRSPIVLSPTQEEVTKFKALNVALHNSLQQYNAQMGKQYVFHRDTVPAVYDPHITLVNSLHIQHWALDRNQIINRVNTQLGRTPLELLQRPAPHFQPTPVPQIQPMPVPQLKRHARHKHARHARHKQVRHAHRHRHAHQSRRHAHRHKHAPQFKRSAHRRKHVSHRRRHR